MMTDLLPLIRRLTRSGRPPAEVLAAVVTRLERDEAERDRWAAECEAGELARRRGVLERYGATEAPF